MVQHLGYTEREPLCLPEFFTKTKLSTESTSLGRFIATAKKCDNSYVNFNIEQGKLIFVYQDTQGGKTAGILYMSITGALDNKMLPIIFTMARLQSIESLGNAVDAENKLIREICEICNLDDVPSLELFVLSPSNVGHYNTRAQYWLQTGLGPIPVLALMPNDTKLPLLVEKVVPYIAGIKNAQGKPIRDTNGNLPTLLLIDEADQIFKSADHTAVSEKHLNKEVDLGAQVKRGSLFDSMSTTAYISATQMAVASNIDLSSHRPEDCVVIEPVLSELSWQYRRKENHRNKVIHRKYLVEKKTGEEGAKDKGKKGKAKEVGGGGKARGKKTKSSAQKALENKQKAEDLYTRVVEVVDDVVKCAHYRALLISCTSLYENDTRTEAARTLIKKSGSEPGVLIFSWSNNSLNIWTKDSVIIEALNGCSAVTEKAAKDMEEEGIMEFVSTKRSYRQVLSKLSSSLSGKDDVVLKIIIFSNGMTERSVSVKGTGHEYPLTDMYIAGHTNRSTMLQRCGRLAGSSSDAFDRTLWGTKAIQDFHQESFRVNDMHVQSLKDGLSVQDSCREVMAAAKAAPEGTEIKVRQNVFFCVSHHNDRAGAIKRGLVAKQEGQKLAVNKKCKLMEAEKEKENLVFDKSFLISLGTAEEFQDRGDENEGEPDETVESFVETHRSLLVKIFKEVINTACAPLTVAEMAKRMAENCRFPGSGLRDVLIVKHVRDIEWSFDKSAGMFKEAGVFCDGAKPFVKWA